MARQRSLFSLVLVLLATFLISCGGPSVATPPPTYTQAQLQKIQEYSTDVIAVRDRAQELEQLIDKGDWIMVGNFIHGPMAEARYDMNYIVSNLLPKEQQTARKVARTMFEHLVKIDQAATSGNANNAYSNYRAAYADLDQFIKLIPETKTSQEAS
jgi:photosystem II protein PsbQ